MHKLITKGGKGTREDFSRLDVKGRLLTVAVVLLGIGHILQGQALRELEARHNYLSARMALQHQTIGIVVDVVEEVSQEDVKTYREGKR